MKNSTKPVSENGSIKFYILIALLVTALSMCFVLWRLSNSRVKELESEKDKFYDVKMKRMQDSIESVNDRLFRALYEAISASKLIDSLEKELKLPHEKYIIKRDSIHLLPATDRDSIIHAIGRDRR